VFTLGLFSKWIRVLAQPRRCFFSFVFIDYPKDTRSIEITTSVVIPVFLSCLPVRKKTYHFGKSDLDELVIALSKAGAPPGSWLYGDTKPYWFQAEIFGETSPRGPVLQRDLY
jgi:hypothetical protein|tara:strand:- start:1737 stop:2075 length:339 start_codon:yes stop_codon:yes gene_type:complete